MIFSYYAKSQFLKILNNLVRKRNNIFIILNMEKEKRPPEKMVGLLAGPWSWNLPDFHHQRPKIIKNHKIKNTPSILSLIKVSKKSKKIKKVKFFRFLMILATDQRGDLVWIRFLETLINEWKMTWVWKNNTIFRETTIYSYSWEHRKHVFLFFWLQCNFAFKKHWKNPEIE